MYCRVRDLGSFPEPSQMALSASVQPGSEMSIRTDAEEDVTVRRTVPMWVAPSVVQPCTPDQISMVSLPSTLFVQLKSSVSLFSRQTACSPFTHADTQPSGSTTTVGAGVGGGVAAPPGAGVSAAAGASVEEPDWHTVTSIAR